MRFSTRALGVACAVMLSGCFAGDVSVVKASRITGWSQFTVEQLLDKRKACSRVEWKSFKDTRDRSVVEYTCESAAGKNYLQRFVQIGIDEAQKKLKGELHNESAYAERDQRDIALAKENLQDEVNAVENRLTRIEELKRDIGRINQATLTSCRDLDVSSFSRLISAEIQSFSRACIQAISRNQPREMEISRDMVISAAEYQIRNQKSAIENNKTQIDFQGSRLEQQLASIERQKVERKEYEVKRRNDAQADLVALERHWANVKGVREVSQWVMQGKEPIYLGSRIDLVLTDKTIEVPVTARLVFNQAEKDGEDLTPAYEFALREAWNRYPMKP